MQNEEIVRSHGVELCVETFGDPAHPTILLVHGASASMLWWPREFCERLAAGRRHVVRFDTRDTGRSTGFPAGRPGYTLADLAEDAIGVLDALGVDRAHLVGRSMGGGTVVLAALLHPERVASLSLVSTTTGSPDLPPPARGFAEYTSTRRPNPADPADVVDFIVGLARMYAGDSPYFDEAATKELAERDVARTADIAACLVNHFLIDVSMPAEAWDRRVEAPVLILHGDRDPVFPPAHALASQRQYPDSELVILPQTGHDLPHQVWDVAIPALLRHTSGGWQEEVDRISAASLAAGDPVGWFETLYSAGAEGSVEMPWSRRDPHPLLVQWGLQYGPPGIGRSAAVVGCGLGADAEFVAGLGYDTIAFDVSPTAVRVAQDRFPGSAVEYRTADLLDPPKEWNRGFELVVEVVTVQALPASVRERAIANIAALVAPGGRLFVVSAIHDSAEPGPPWPLTRAEVESFAQDGLKVVTLEAAEVPERRGETRWCAVFERLMAG